MVGNILYWGGSLQLHHLSCDNENKASMVVMKSCTTCPIAVVMFLVFMVASSYHTFNLYWHLVIAGDVHINYIVRYVFKVWLGQSSTTYIHTFQLLRDLLIQLVALWM